MRSLWRSMNSYLNTTSTQESPDSVALRLIGLKLYYALTITSTFTLIYGFFVLLFLYSVVAYFTQRNSSRSQRLMFLVTIITFILATIVEAIQIFEATIWIHTVFMQDHKSTLAENYNRGLDRSTAPVFLAGWANILAAFIGDCTIIWRAFVLLQRRWWIIILPLLLAVCSVVFNVPSSLIFSTHYVEGWSHGWKWTLSQSAICLSLATNVVTTTLIGHVYWEEMLLALGTHRKTQVENVLALLLESGVIFGILQSTTVILTYLPAAQLGTPRSYAYGILLTMYTGSAIMYPTVLVAMVNRHRTFDQMCSLNNFPQSRNENARMGHTYLSQDMEFASPPLTTKVSEDQSPGRDRDGEQIF